MNYGMVGATLRVWQAANEITWETGRPPRRKEVIERIVSESGNQNTASSEVIAKLVEKVTPEAATIAFDALLMPVSAFMPDIAAAAGRLRAATRSRGLSLGGRSCLAEAGATGRSVLTTDRSWAELDLGIEIEVIR